MDQTGTIIAINKSWERFAQENGDPSLSNMGIGTNYLAVCDSASGEFADEARPAGEGIRAVLRGELAQISLEYPCHSSVTRRWFLMNVVPLDGNTNRAVISHTDITERRLTEQALRQSEAHNRALLAAMPEQFSSYARAEYMLFRQYYHPYH